jgi:hypothetical protein
MAVPGDTQCHEVAPCGTGDVVVSGADATIDATVVRDTQPLNDGTAGHGIEVVPDIDMKKPGRDKISAFLAPWWFKISLFSGDFKPFVVLAPI